MKRMSHLLLIIVVSVFVLAGCSSPEEKAQEFYENGKALLEDGKVIKARIQFQNALQLNKKMVGPWYGLAQIAEKKKQWKKVFKLLRTVVELDPNHTEAQLKIGKIYLISGQLEEGLKTSNLLMELMPGNADAFALHAALLLKSGDKKGAVDYAGRALAVDALNTEALMVLANERLQDKDAQKAIEFLDKGISADDANAALYLVKLQALQMLNKYDEMESILKHLVELEPTNVSYSHTLAKFYLTRGRKADAEKILRDLAKADAGDIESKLNLIRFVGSYKGRGSAINELETMISDEPENYELKFALAEVLLRSNKHDDAIKLLQSLTADSEPQKVQLRAKGQLAAIDYVSGKIDKAIQAVEEILEKDSTNEQALIIQSSHLIDNARYDDAILKLRTVIKDTPDSAKALLLLGTAHEKRGSSELADDMYARAYNASDKNTGYAQQYAQFLLKVGKYDRAIDILNEVRVINPNNLKILALLTEAYIANGDMQEAKSLVKYISKIDIKGGLIQQVFGSMRVQKDQVENNIESIKNLNTTSLVETRPLVSLVNSYLVSGKQDEALQFLDEIISENNNNINARSLKAQVFTLQGKLEKATQEYRKIISIAPHSSDGYYNLGKLILRHGNVNDALSVIDEGIKEVPESFLLLMSKAGILQGKKDFQGAIEVYEKIHKLEPTSEVVINNLASLLSDHSGDDAVRLKRANELAQRFSESKTPQFKDTLGWTYFKLGNLEEARTHITDAVTNMPNDPSLRYHMGMVFEKLGENDSAKQEYEKSLELATGRPFEYRNDVNEALQRL